MERMFLTVDAYRLSAAPGDPAARAGGESWVCCRPRQPAGGRRGVLLRLEDYRPAPAPQVQPARPRRRRRGRAVRAWLGLLLDAAATAAVLALTAGALVCFSNW